MLECGWQVGSDGWRWCVGGWLEAVCAEIDRQQMVHPALAAFRLNVSGLMLRLACVRLADKLQPAQNSGSRGLESTLRLADACFAAQIAIV
jgi:hypothetical protein